METLLSLAILCNSVLEPRGFLRVHLGHGFADRVEYVLMVCVKDFAIRDELMDPREDRYIFASAFDLKANLKLVLDRAKTLRGVPYISFAQLYPSRVDAIEMLQFNRAYLNHLKLLQDSRLRHDDWLDSAISKTENLWHVYDNVRDCGAEYAHIVPKRMALKSLQERLGAEFWSGHLPHCIPTEYLQEIR